MRIGILGTVDNPYIADIQRAAQQYFPSIETCALRFGDLQVGIGDAAAEAVAPVFPLSRQASQASSASTNGDGDANRLEALIVRSMPIGSLEQVIFRMGCLQTWQSRGVEVVNSPQSLEIAIDKWLCLQRLAAAGVAVPATICCQSRGAAMEAFESLGGDVLIKPLFGGEGRGILRATNKDMAWRVFGTLQQLGQVLYVQQTIDHEGYDIRVLFIDNKLFAMRRTAAANEWRTNISQGGSGQKHRLTSEQVEVARRARTAVGGRFVGVDLLPARDGRLFVLEVNAVPGWKGLAAALEVDIAKELLSSLVDGTV